MVDGCGWGGLSMMDYPNMAYRIIVVCPGIWGQLVPFSWEPEGFVLRVQRFAVNLATKVSVFFTSNSSGNSRLVATQ